MYITSSPIYSDFLGEETTEISIHHVFGMFVCIISWLASDFYQLMQTYGLCAN